MGRGYDSYLERYTNITEHILNISVYREQYHQHDRTYLEIAGRVEITATLARTNASSLRTQPCKALRHPRIVHGQTTSSGVIYRAIALSTHMPFPLFAYPLLLRDRDSRHRLGACRQLPSSVRTAVSPAEASPYDLR
jgi:hypothetical protein